MEPSTFFSSPYSINVFLILSDSTYNRHGDEYWIHICLLSILCHLSYLCKQITGRNIFISQWGTIPQLNIPLIIKSFSLMNILLNSHSIMYFPFYVFREIYVTLFVHAYAEWQRLAGIIKQSSNSFWDNFSMCWHLRLWLLAGNCIWFGYK